MENLSWYVLASSADSFHALDRRGDLKAASPTIMLKTFLQTHSTKYTALSAHNRHPGLSSRAGHPPAPSWGARFTCAATAPSIDVASYQWTGEDEFTGLDDRRELDPILLPTISTHKRIVLVRHGQSTWNAEGRIQGSTNFAVLTKKGQDQAATTHEMVSTAVAKFKPAWEGFKSIVFSDKQQSVCNWLAQPRDTN